MGGDGSLAIGPYNNFSSGEPLDCGLWMSFGSAAHLNALAELGLDETRFNCHQRRTRILAT